MMVTIMVMMVMMIVMIVIIVVTIPGPARTPSVVAHTVEVIILKMPRECGELRRHIEHRLRHTRHQLARVLP
jgi:uncharacterized membrane protein YqjE